jgi:hypothetical protein
MFRSHDSPLSQAADTLHDPPASFRMEVTAAVAIIALARKVITNSLHIHYTSSN